MTGEGNTPPEGVERDYPLSRLTTVRTGGPADYFARPASEAELAKLLSWARGAGLDVAVVGSGSNLLVADQGYRGLVLKLAGELTGIEQEGSRILCGGGARLPSAAARAADWGLTGLEFGVNIPGTVGGAVRMNANAYGGELGRVLEWVVICDAGGPQQKPPDELGLRYRDSDIGPGQVVARAAFALQEGRTADIKRTMGEMRDRRREAQPSGVKTFGSTFVNPDDPRAEGRSAGQLLDAAGCRGLERGGARLSPKHANFIENSGDATTADVLAVMAAGRRRVFEATGVTLRPEVQLLGGVDWPQEWQLDD